ncbi:hypothetical protein GCM10017620_24910 [Brevundimonas intermedia]|uniref:Uncharacterized protein n=1 Tax=Brevundimonas intermedia TaxID=74315 RepID=A0ABQ5TAV9_9CAUL|nr:hypothetical protein [Brevundimonas intermedia]GLK49518.1 hypothetical protein GCM10017620_24910 [Brevundimonas intermedia]
MNVVERIQKAIEQLTLHGNTPIRVELNKVDYAAIQAATEFPEGWPETLCGLDFIMVDTMISAVVAQGNGPTPGRVSQGF